MTNVLSILITKAQAIAVVQRLQGGWKEGCGGGVEQGNTVELQLHWSSVYLSSTILFFLLLQGLKQSEVNTSCSQTEIQGTI